MANNYKQPGETLTWTNTTGTAVASGDVIVLGAASDATLGVAMVDIPNGEIGEVCINGVFEVPKVAAAVFALGESLVWDASAGAFDDNAAIPAAGDVSGSVIAARAGANGAATCWAKFLGIPGELA